MTHKEHVALCMKRFDFDKAWRIMVALNWRYGYADSEHTPTLVEIKEAAESLLNRLEETAWIRSSRLEGTAWIRGSGFLARKLKDEMQNDYYELFFIPEDSDSEYPEP